MLTSHLLLFLLVGRFQRVSIKGNGRNRCRQSEQMD